MNDPDQNICRRFNRADRRLKNLAQKIPDSRLLSERVAGTSEETAALFSSGTTPAVKVIPETPSCAALLAASGGDRRPQSQTGKCPPVV